MDIITLETKRLEPANTSLLIKNQYTMLTVLQIALQDFWPKKETLDFFCQNDFPEGCTYSVTLQIRLASLQTIDILFRITRLLFSENIAPKGYVVVSSDLHQFNKGEVQNRLSIILRHTHIDLVNLSE